MTNWWESKEAIKIKRRMTKWQNILTRARNGEAVSDKDVEKASNKILELQHEFALVGNEWYRLHK